MLWTIFLIIASYLTVAGFTGNYLTLRARYACGGSRPCKSSRCEHGSWWTAGFRWIIAGPILLGAAASRSMARNHALGISREQRKLQKQIAIAEHRDKIIAMREAELAKMEKIRKEELAKMEQAAGLPPLERR